MLSRIKLLSANAVICIRHLPFLDHPDDKIGRIEAVGPGIL